MLTLALSKSWQLALLVASALLLFVRRSPIVPTLLLCGVAGTVAALVGAPLG